MNTMMSARRVHCGLLFRDRMTNLADIVLFGGNQDTSSKLYYATLDELMNCANIQADDFSALEQYERWQSFWAFVAASHRVQTDPKQAESLLADLKESFCLHAKTLGILEDYGTLKMMLLCRMASDSLTALKAGNTHLAKTFAERGANIQYWLAIEKLDMSPP